MKTVKIVLAVGLILASVGIATQLSTDQPLSKEVPDKKTVVYYVPAARYFSSTANINNADLTGKTIHVLPEDKPQVEAILGSEINYAIAPSMEQINKMAGGDIAIVRWDRISPNLKTLSYEGKLLWNKNDISGYKLKTEVSLPEDKVAEVSFDPEKLTKLNFLGDIMLSRHVNTQMERLGFGYPWEKVKTQIADADITFANLEVPISDRYDAPAEGMSFVAPTKNLEYLKSAGIDIVSVANNHTANFGTQAFLDNIKNLKAAGIGICGGGLTEAEARKATTIKVNDLNFNFLCQSAVVGSLYADGGNPGVPYLGIEPWYRQNRDSLSDLVADIEAARLSEGVTIDSPHWGVEYKHSPNDDQQTVARLMIDSGVDLVIGTHPHVVQSLEFYKNKYISYSLGNFIFDQEWSEATKQGTMASVYYYGSKNVAVNLVPLQIENYAQPRFVTGTLAGRIINIIQKSSLGF
jgi:poly-gamma-glutamate synthesis protein (capsule biosynthesis protein)